ncbi:hypothetical protein ACFQ0M_15190 [Kitasatospora aburaviensis]
MIIWTFSPQDLARTRFACSPLCEVALSVEVFKDPGRHGVHLPWVREARRRLAGWAGNCSPSWSGSPPSTCRTS